MRADDSTCYVCIFSISFFSLYFIYYIYYLFSLCDCFLLLFFVFISFFMPIFLFILIRYHNIACLLLFSICIFSLCLFCMNCLQCSFSVLLWCLVLFVYFPSFFFFWFSYYYYVCSLFSFLALGTTRLLLKCGLLRVCIEDS